MSKERFWKHNTTSLYIYVVNKLQVRFFPLTLGLMAFKQILTQHHAKKIPSRGFI